MVEDTPRDDCRSPTSVRDFDMFEKRQHLVKTSSLKSATNHVKRPSVEPLTHHVKRPALESARIHIKRPSL